MRWAWLPFGLLGLLLLWLAPLWGPLLRHGAWPHPWGLKAPLHLLAYGVSPEYLGHHRKAPEGFRGLADAILLVRFDPKGQVVVLSIPRDVEVFLPGHGLHKINAANPLGGPGLLKEAVEGLLGLPVHRYLALSLEGLRAGVEALGGVRVCLDRPLFYRDQAAGLLIDLPAGCQVLDGRGAEGYLRFRKDALGDIGRIQRQQAFFQALKAKLLTPEGLWRLPRAVGAVAPHLRTDLTQEERGALLGFLLRRPRLVTLLLPGRFGGGWRVDGEAWAALKAVHFEGQPLPRVSLAGRTVALAYGPGEETSLQRAEEALRALGLRVVPWPLPAPPARTEVLENGPGALAQALGEALGLPYRVSGEALLGADLTLRLAPGGLE